MVPVERCEAGDVRMTGHPFRGHDVSEITDLPSGPSKRSLVTACSSDGLFSPGGRVGANPHPPKLALGAAGLSVCPPVRRRRCTLPNDKTPHDTASIEDILTQPPLPNASIAPTHPCFPLIPSCEIVDSSSSRRPILQPIHPPSLDHGYRLHQGCCPACVDPLT